MATFTRITATRPGIVTKSFSLVDGVLTKLTVANVTAGNMEVVEVATIEDFAATLESLGPSHCLTYGVPPVATADLVTKDEWHKLGKPKDRLPRTQEIFSWPTGPGILLLDYDAPKDGSAPIAREELLTALDAAANGLLKEAYSHVWWPSTSSCIFDGETELVGVKGQRVYLMAEDARDIPRVGQAICDRLWSLGYGRYEVSKSGQMLERPLFDATVWQANRIDFAAGASCAGTLHQRRGSPQVIDGYVSDTINTRELFPDLTPAERRQADQNKAAAKALVREQAAQARAVWKAERAEAILSAKNPGGTTVEVSEAEFNAAMAVAERAIERGELMGDWLITVVDGGACTEVSILHILDHAEQFHGRLTLDPIEPDYDGGRAVGKLFLMGARPCLYSMAHGGTTYKLFRQPQNIETVKGKLHETTNRLLDVLRRANDVFDYGSEIVSVAEGGHLLSLDAFSLTYLVSGLTQFFHTKELQSGEILTVLDDPPGPPIRAIVSLGAARKLKPLDAVITAPTLRLDGSILDVPGYDKATRLLFDGDGDHPVIPLQPTKDQALAALATVWEPFKDFPFAEPLDQAVHLAAILTAAIRPVLPTAPAFSYDAPVQGSGKTLLASCISVIATGTEPSAMPPISSNDDEEIRKRLFTELRGGNRVILWDNVVGNLDSPAMATMLTSPNYSDRILGASESATVPNRAILLLTGNNFAAVGDLSRRILVCRIDPETDRPFARQFNLNPLAHCQAYRLEIVAAALTLIRYHFQYGEQLGAGAIASFEDWDRLVRQTVLRADQLWPGQFADVMNRVIINQETDPEQESLDQFLTAWEAVFGATQVTAQEVLHRIGEYMNEPAQQLKAALRELAPSVKDFSEKSIGNILKFRKGRIVNGRRLVARRIAKKSWWSVTGGSKVGQRVSCVPHARDSM